MVIKHLMTAQEVRTLADNSYLSNVYNIINEIRKQVLEGNYEIKVVIPPNKSEMIKSKLEELGYTVQVYNEIRWKINW